MSLVYKQVNSVFFNRKKQRLNMRDVPETTLNSGVGLIGAQAQDF